MLPSFSPIMMGGCQGNYQQTSSNGCFLDLLARINFTSQIMRRPLIILTLVILFLFLPHSLLVSHHPLCLASMCLPYEIWCLNYSPSICVQPSSCGYHRPSFCSAKAGSSKLHAIFHGTYINFFDPNVLFCFNLPNFKAIKPMLRTGREIFIYRTDIQNYF